MHAVTLPKGTRDQLEAALDLLVRCESENVVSRAEALYAQWYALPFQPFEVPDGCPPDLVEMLRAAHSGFLEWEDGWRVESVGARGQIVVRQDGQVRLL